MTLSIIALLLLFAPLAWEVINDANGETKKDKFPDVLVRIGIGLLVGVAHLLLVNEPIIDAFILSMAIHFLLFDYVIQYILIRKGIIETKSNCFEYVGKTSSLDKWNVWINLKPWGRLAVKLSVFIIATLMYIL